MNASEIKVPKGVTSTQVFHPALGMRTITAPVPAPPVERPKFHMAIPMPKNPNPNRNVWGTDIEMIDGAGYCIDCEHAIPGHFDNCDHAGRGQ